MDYGITIRVPVPFTEAVIISRSWAWLPARMRDDWQGYHGTNDSRREIPPRVFLRVPGQQCLAD
jgi:hypothetical protein